MGLTTPDGLRTPAARSPDLTASPIRISWPSTGLGHLLRQQPHGQTHRFVPDDIVRRWLREGDMVASGFSMRVL